MGQYFLIVNLNKKEYLHPHKLGSGLKLWEICASDMPRILPFLLRKSNEGGGGDLDDEEYKYAGRWAGDRLVCIGDYDESGLFNKASESYKDISEEVKDEFNRFMESSELMIFADKEEEIAYKLKTNRNHTAE